MKVRRRRLLISLYVLLFLFGGLFIAGYFVLQSQWLREQIRVRALQIIENATGGRAEMGSFDFDPNTLRFTVERFTLHGTEPASAPPLFHGPRIVVGLKILSFFSPKVDLQSVMIESPSFNLLRYADGSTNLPTPKNARTRPGTIMTDIIKLAIDNCTIRNGIFTYEQKREPFSLAGRDISVDLSFLPAQSRYDGAVHSRAFELEIAGRTSFKGDVSAEVSIYEDTLSVRKAHADLGRTEVDATGEVNDFRTPRVRLTLTAHSDLAETPLGTGPVVSSGIFTYSASESYRYEGDLQGSNLQVRGVSPIAVRGRVLWVPDSVRATQLIATSGEGRFEGAAEVIQFQRFVAKGQISELSLGAVMRHAEAPQMGYSGLISGPVEIGGYFRGPLRATADVQIVPTDAAIPLEGNVRVSYDQGTNLLAFGESYLATPSTRAEFSGKMNESLRISARTRRLEDALPALGMDKLPVTLNGGDAAFEGTIAGNVRDPQISGNVTAKRLQYDKYILDTVSASAILSSAHLTVSQFTISHRGAQAEGMGQITLANWRASEDSPLSARVSIRDLNPALFRTDLPFKGVVNASGTVRGTIRRPEVSASLDLPKPVIRDQQLDRVRASLRYKDSRVEIDSLEAVRGTTRLTGSGSAQENGSFAVAFDLSGVQFSEWRSIPELPEQLTGTLRAEAKLAGRLKGREPQLESANFDAALQELAFSGKTLGEVSFRGATENAGLNVSMSGKLRGAVIGGTGRYQLIPGYPGSASVQLATVPFSVLEDLRPGSGKSEPWPFTGSISAALNVAGPALDPEQWKAELTVPEVLVRPARTQLGGGTAAQQVFELRNDGPLRFSIDQGVVSVQQVRFIAADTNLSASGTFSLAQRRPWDLRINGSLNLAGLRTFSPDILGGGVATLEANVRGELENPQLFGRLDLKDASFFLEGIPSGLDQVNGRILFDTRRATIERELTAQSGGGALSLSGFIEFAREETFYRLQAVANSVRVRYPEGLSTVADGSLSLTGSSTQSLLSGTIVVERSGFQPRTDLGSLLSEASRGQDSPLSANPFLSNMQLDVRVRTAPNTQFTTSLTSDLQADANLNVRGSAARPIVQGRITVNQGDVNFFGTKYTIKRGEISFYNTTRIEPVLDMDVETRIRAVTVGINFSGPINKLNVSYRSDPPLAPTEIIALLTVGRSPDSRSYGSPGTQSGSLFQTGANTLLGNAIAAPISNQLQRFFGVSRIKIDPLLSGLEGTPLARVTVEQQVSKDVTLTFVSTLNRTQQQVVRLEWNLSKEWSVIALRDENGSFGLDFQIRKQIR